MCYNRQITDEEIKAYYKKLRLETF